MSTVRGGGRRWAAAVVGLSLLTGLAVVVEVDRARPASAEQGATTSLVSRVGGNGQQQPAGPADLATLGTPVFASSNPSISDDGAVVAWEVARDPSSFVNKQRIVLIRDQRVTAPNANAEAPVDWFDATTDNPLISIGNSDSTQAWAPEVSGDGCYVTFFTNQAIDPNDTPSTNSNDPKLNADVYRFTMPSCRAATDPAMALVSYGSFRGGGLALSFAGFVTEPPGSINFGYTFGSPTIPTGGTTFEFELRLQPATGRAVEITTLDIGLPFSAPSGVTVFDVWRIGPPSTPGATPCREGTVLVDVARPSCRFTINADPARAVLSPGVTTFPNEQASATLVIRGSGGASVPNRTLLVNQAADFAVSVSPATPASSTLNVFDFTVTLTAQARASIRSIGFAAPEANVTLNGGTCAVGLILNAANPPTPAQSCTVVVRFANGEGTTDSANLLVDQATFGFQANVALEYTNQLDPIGNRISLERAAVAVPARLPVLAQAPPVPVPGPLGALDPEAFRFTDEKLAISEDGSVVAYPADSPLVTADPSGAETVYLVDLGLAPGSAGFTTAVPGPTGPGPFDFVAASTAPALSADGATVAFESDRLLPGAPDPDGDGWGFPGAVWRYTVGGSPSPVSVPPTGVPTASSGAPDISADGTAITFESDARNLDPAIPAESYANPGEGTYAQVFLAVVGQPVRLLTRADPAAPVTCGSFGPSGTPVLTGCGDSNEPAISGDGQFVTFTSFTDNLVPPFPAITDRQFQQVLIASTATLRPIGRISVRTDNVSPANCPDNNNFYPCNIESAIDATGRNVAWSSQGNPMDLTAPGPNVTVGGEPNLFNEQLVYVRNRPPVVTLTPNPVSFGVVPVGSSRTITVTATNTGLSAFVTGQVLTQLQPPFSVTGGTCTVPLPDGSLPPIPAGGSCTINATYTGRTDDLAGVASNLVLAEPAARFQALTVLDPLRATATNSPLVIQPNPDDFGNTNIGTTAPPRTYTITNVSDVPIGVTGVTLGGTNPGDFGLSNDTCTGATLAPGATCTVTVTFTPSAEGTRTTNVVVTGTVPSDPAAPPVTAIGTVTGTGVAIRSLQITPAPFNFGLIRIGTQSTARVFTITNTGNVANAVSAGALGGANANQFVITANGCNTSLAVNASCTVAVAFRPTSGGTKSATIGVTGQGGSSASSDLSGRGGAVALAFAPNTITYGITAVGLAAPNQATVLRNTGDLSVQLTAVTIAGANAADFSIVTSTCTTGLTLPAGGTCTVTVRFAPTGGGTRTATLTAVGNPTVAASAALTGTGNGQFLLSISPSPATFEQLIVNQTSAPAVLTVRNIGATPNTINSALLSGPDANQFTITTNGCTTGLVLAPGATCQVGVTFTPTTSGTLVGALVVIGTGGSSATATLTGTSLFSPTIIVTPDIARPGQVVTAIGTGFPPNTPIQVFFQDSPDQIITTLTQPDGTFRIPILLTGGQPTGPRAIVVLDIPNQFTNVPAAPILVSLATVDPQDNLFVLPLIDGQLSWLSRG